MTTENADAYRQLCSYKAKQMQTTTKRRQGDNIKFRNGIECHKRIKTFVIISQFVG